MQSAPDTAGWLALLDALPPGLRARWGQAFADRAMALGLAVTLPDGATRAIPPVLSPQVVEPAWQAQQADRSAALVEAIALVVRELLGGLDPAAVRDGLFPLEREALDSAGLPLRLATTRADLFLGPRGAQALEVNTTIPAMQGYSDIAARAWLESLGSLLGLPDVEVAKEVAAQGSNTLELLKALQACHRAETGGREFASVALVHRPGDSQLTELRYLARRWQEQGIAAHVVEAGQLSLRAGRVYAGREPVDFVYRHIFARRIEPRSEMERLLLDPARAVMANRMSAPLEMKRCLAELSAALDGDPAALPFSLDASLRRRLEGFVPWTRPFRAGRALLPGGEAVDDLVAAVAARPERFVLKRSWDYGGKAVFLGFEAEEEVGLARAEAAYGARLGWAELCGRCAVDPQGGGYVVQERVEASKSPRWVVDADGPVRRDLFADFSIYASLGLGAVKPAWRGVVRCSTSAVVNIAGGGGVAPVLEGERLASWAARLEALPR